MDTLFIMGYDSQDNIITASASSPLDKITTGVENYLKMGIPKEKLVLGVHWASYRYPCVYMNRHDVSANKNYNSIKRIRTRSHRASSTSLID